MSEGHFVRRRMAELEAELEELERCWRIQTERLEKLQRAVHAYFADRGDDFGEDGYAAWVERWGARSE